MEHVRSLWGSRYAVVDVVWFLVGDSNDKNDGFGWQILGDAPLRPTFPPIFLRHLCIFPLIVTSPRWSSLAAPIPESDGHVT